MSDPRMILTANGSTLQFTGGQPALDDGLENAALISLFTSPGWCGNGFIKTAIGSDFEQACNQPITRKALSDIRNAAERAIPGATAMVNNPSSSRLDITITLPYGRALSLTRQGGNWSYQAGTAA